MKPHVIAWVLALAACGGSTPEVKQPDGNGPSDPQGPKVTKTDPGLPNAQGTSGIVFAPDGKTRELRVVATGGTVQVSDGTPLKLVSVQAEKGFGRAEAMVEIDGKVGILPNNAVLIGDRLRRTPVSKVAIFYATSVCDPDCVAEVWALHPDGRRLSITRSVSDPSFAFSPDGSQVAIGGAGLWLLHVGTWKVFSYKEFSAPAFAYDSSLYVRSHGDSDVVLRYFFGGQVSEVASFEGVPSTDIPLPVTFDDGGKTIVATFMRKAGDKTVRVPR